MPITADYKCGDCGLSFGSYDELSKHMAKTHMPKPKEKGK